MVAHAQTRQQKIQKRQSGVAKTSTLPSLYFPSFQLLLASMHAFAISFDFFFAHLFECVHTGGVWGSFVSNCITVDDRLFPLKTCFCFLQHIASKPDKVGIKFWVACDLKSKYICNVLPYLG